jgi:hypothetical protein
MSDLFAYEHKRLLDLVEAWENQVHLKFMGADRENDPMGKDLLNMTLCATLTVRENLGES